MEMSILLAEQIAGLFLMILFGFLIVKFGVLKAEDSKVISKIAMYVLMPCVIINAFQIEYTADTMHSLIVSYGIVILIHAVWVLFTPVNQKIFGLNEVEAASVLYPNTGNIIVPLVTAILGEKWILFTAPMMSFQILVVWTHGVRLLSREEGLSLKKIFTNVNMIACFIGLLLFVTKLRFPAVIGTPIKTVGSTIGAMTMIATGMLMAEIDLKKIFLNKRMYLTAFLRLMVFSFIALLLLKYLPFRSMIKDGETIFFIILLGASVPTAATITQMAQVYGKGGDGAYAGAINVVTTLLCLITMPIMAMLYYL